MNTRSRTLRLATRGSDLALRQAASVKSALENRRHTVELVEVETTGDQIQDELIHRLGKTGAFVRSLDQTVLDGDLDGAIHSMKDMPTEQPDELVVAGVPERGPADDVLLTPDGDGLDDLPEGATVGTSSLRRQAQLLAQRPDLDVQPLRGNIDTRVEKLLAPGLISEHEQRLDAAEDDTDEFDQSIEDWFDGLTEIQRTAMEREIDTEYDAIVLARAGLERAGLLHHVGFESLPREEFVPAPGQGALAVTALDGDVAEDIQSILDHPPARVATSVERIVLHELGGGCVAPIGVNAVVQGAVVHTTVQVLGRDGTEQIQVSRDLPAARYPTAARELAAELRDQGAAELIADARRETPDDAKREE